MCLLCVHADTVLLCLKHHFSIPARGTEGNVQQRHFSPDTIHQERQPQDGFNHLVILPPSPATHFLPPEEADESEEDRRRSEKSQLWYSEIDQKSTCLVLNEIETLRLCFTLCKN